MTYIMVDVESDGQIPGITDYSMVCFGAVLVRDPSQTFYGTTKPISEKWDPQALAISGFSREEHEAFDDPAETMLKFKEWIESVVRVFPDGSKDRPHFIADNNGYDFAFINWYFHHFLGENPFGHSSRNLGDLYKGCTRNMRGSFKKLRKTKHTHNPVDDAMGNVEALQAMIEKFDLKGKF